MKAKQFIIIVFTLLFSLPAWGAAKELHPLKGLSFGLGLSAENRDIKAIGLSGHLGFDFAQPVNDSLALGFSLELGGGFMGAVHPYSQYDRFYVPFTFSLGFLMEQGNLNEKPFIFGLTPCTGIGFVDMDLVLPLKLRIGRFFYKRWYIMGELTMGISLAHETLYFEPSLLVGYNFGQNKRGKKEK